MAITFEEFVAKAPVLEAVLVTAENVEELATWMGADAYSVQKTLVGGRRKVTFEKLRTNDRYPSHVYADRMVETEIGHYLVRRPEFIDGQLREYDDRFFSITQADITNFKNQLEKQGYVDPDSRASDKE